MDPMSKTLQYAATSPQSCRFSHVKSLRVRVGLLSTVDTKESLISLLVVVVVLYCNETPLTNQNDDDDGDDDDGDDDDDD
jgi:hypothetical protein